MSYSRNTKRGNRSRSLSGEGVQIPIPKDKVGLVIGRNGGTVQEIRDRTGAQISIKNNHAYLRGTPEQCNTARELIEKILKSAREEGGSSQGGFRKLNIEIPQRFMGLVIGKGREKLSNIETKTGVALKVIDNNLHVKGSTEREKKVIREIMAIVNLAMARSQLPVSITRLAYVDTAQLEENHEFGLSSTSLKASTGENCFKLQLLEHPLQEETSFDLVDTESLKEEILKVLKHIHKEKEEEMIKVDMWCHFGHAYVTKVDEAEETETFTLMEVKEKIESGDGTGWKLFFKEGVERIEVEQIEKDLPSSTAKEDIRYDFTFYTPSCREVCVKAWLIEEGEEENNGASSLSFSRSAPVPVKNTLTRVLSDEHSQTEDASNEPCLHICSKFHQRMKVDILILSKGFDCRLSIRTCPDVSKTPEAEKEEARILKSYLDEGMKIEEGQLVLPPVSTRPDGFDLFYQRRSLRKTYQYEMDGEQFSLTVCKDQAEIVDTEETVVKSFDETPAMTDVHLHCEEWDRLLDEGDWEPQQIAAKLPTFLKFLRQVQRNVAPQAIASGE